MFASEESVDVAIMGLKRKYPGISRKVDLNLKRHPSTGLYTLSFIDTERLRSLHRDTVQSLTWCSRYRATLRHFSAFGEVPVVLRGSKRDEVTILINLHQPLHYISEIYVSIGDCGLQVWERRCQCFGCLWRSILLHRHPKHSVLKMRRKWLCDWSQESLPKTSESIIKCWEVLIRQIPYVWAAWWGL